MANGPVLLDGGNVTLDGEVIGSALQNKDGTWAITSVGDPSVYICHSQREALASVHQFWASNKSDDLDRP